MYKTAKIPRLIRFIVKRSRDGADDLNIYMHWDNITVPQINLDKYILFVMLYSIQKSKKN